jgi:hypothetical protein
MLFKLFLAGLGGLPRFFWLPRQVPVRDWLGATILQYRVSQVGALKYINYD